MPLFTTILCDLDGTLIDSQRDIAVAFQHALRTVVGENVPEESAIARHIGKPLAQMAVELGYDLPAPERELFLHTYRQYYAQHCAHHTRPYPGVIATLQTFTALQLGIVTTKQQAQAEAVLTQLCMTTFFQHIQGWQPGLQLKPAPDMVLATLTALRCQPHEALMVGDTPADILAGKAAGTRTCAVTYGFGTEDELRRCQPDYVISQFRDLCTFIEPR